MFFHENSEEAKAHAMARSLDDSLATEGKHDVPLSHELIAAAAAYEAAKAYTNHRKNKGDPMSHDKAFEILAGFSGAWIDKYAETKGMDAVTKAKLKHEAASRTQQGFNQTYRGQM